ncbi:MAG: hypothetical protein Q9195_008763 [Heterodermia aff. obscurata]
MPLQVISAAPSPYARKVRIALAEKRIPFELITEVPWESTTKTPQYNPLEKLPILIFEDGKAIYESSYILDYLEAKYPKTLPLLPADIDRALSAKQVQVVTDGVCDALVLLFFEKQRGADKRSEEWMARQNRKIDGGLKALAEWLGEDESKEFLIGDAFGLADIAAGSLLGYMKVRLADHPWQQRYPNLSRYSDSLERRQSFLQSVPRAQSFTEKVV